MSDISPIYKEEIYSFGGYILGNRLPVKQSSIAYCMGTTANVALIKEKFCYIANVGDSLAVIYKDGKAIKVNSEHKTTLQKEKDRIVNSGRRITNGRIDGRINLTRSIGDFQYKKNNYSLKDNQQAVIPCPEIYKFKITSDIEFMIMGCDGLWDYVDPQKLCEFVSKKLKEKTPIKKHSQ